MSRIKLKDGSSWPRPSLERDDEPGIGWRLRYLSPDKLTKADLMEAASIVDAYGVLVVESTRDVRNMVCREVRQALREELEE